MSNKEDEHMIDKKQEAQQTKNVSDSAVMALAKEGMDKYREALDRLAKS